MSTRTIDERYEIIHKLGVGGMGQVFLGNDLRLNRKVAVKFLNPAIAENPKARERFENEAKSLAKLEQANLGRIYDYGIENNEPFMVLEFIDGTPLDEVLNHGRMPTDVAIPILMEVLDGIGYAHSKGLVHRDLKPSNILLTRDGHAKVIDFGIAFDQGNERKTVDGSIIGTASYFSPEQAAGQIKEIDHRSDLFSLGAVLFEMLTGTPPLEKDTQINTIIAHATLEFPPLPSEFDQSLRTAIDRSLAREKTKRFQTTDEFKVALTNAVPPGAIKSNSVTDFLLKAPPRPTIAEIPSNDPSPINKKILPKKSGRNSVLVYVSVGMLAVAVVIGLWVLREVRGRLAPVPPPIVEIQTPLAPKDLEIVSPPVASPTALPEASAAKPTPSEDAKVARISTLSASKRRDLESRRDKIESDLKQKSAELKSLQALGEDQQRQVSLGKLCTELKRELDSINKSLAAP